MPRASFRGIRNRNSSIGCSSNSSDIQIHLADPIPAGVFNLELMISDAFHNQPDLVAGRIAALALRVGGDSSGIELANLEAAEGEALSVEPVKNFAQPVDL